MKEYSVSDVKKKRKRKKSAPPADNVEHGQKEGGRRIVPFDDVHVYSGSGKAELWWTDFGRLVIRTYGHDQSQHADIDAIQLITNLRLLCSKPTVNQERWRSTETLQLSHDS